MSEIYTHLIYRIPASWTTTGPDGEPVPPAFHERLMEEFYNMPYADPDDGGETWAQTGQARGGLWSLETQIDWLVDHDIPFVAYDEPGDEGGPGSLVIYDGVTAWRCACVGDGEPVLDYHLWKQINEGTHPDWSSADAFFETMGRTPSDFSVEHLRDRLPPLAGGDPDVIRASTIIEALSRVGITARCDQTGGGVATMIIERGERRIMIGPGVYDWIHEDRSEFHFDELSIGIENADPNLDIEGADDATYVTSIDGLVVTTLIIAGADHPPFNPNDPEE